MPDPARLDGASHPVDTGRMMRMMLLIAGMGFILRACSFEPACDQTSIAKLRSEAEALGPAKAVQKMRALRQVSIAERTMAAGDGRACRQHLKRAARQIRR